MVRQPVDASGRRIFGRIFGRSCAAPCASDHAPSRARFARRLGPQPLIDGAGRPVCLLSIAFTASLRLTSSGCTPAGYILGGPGSLRSRATPKHLRAPLIFRVRYASPKNQGTLALRLRSVRLRLTRLPHFVRCFLGLPGSKLRGRAAPPFDCRALGRPLEPWGSSVERLPRPLLASRGCGWTPRPVAINRNGPPSAITRTHAFV